MERGKMVHKTIRVEKDLWDRFMKTAKLKDSDASKEIRKSASIRRSINSPVDIVRISINY